MRKIEQNVILEQVKTFWVDMRALSFVCRGLNPLDLRATVLIHCMWEAGYDLEGNNGQKICTATHEDTGEKFVVRGLEFDEALVELAQQMGILRVEEAS